MRRTLATLAILSVAAFSSLAAPTGAFAEEITDTLQETINDGRGGVEGCTVPNPPAQAACRKAQCPTGGC